MLEKAEVKGRGYAAARWMDSITRAISALLKDMGYQFRDRSLWRKFVCC